MPTIPEEFTILVDRLENLKRKPIIDKQYRFDYTSAIWRFKVVAANNSWKDSAKVVIQKIREYLNDLYKLRSTSYSSITSHFELQSFENDFQEIKTKDSSVFISRKGKTQVQKNTTDEDKRTWFKNIIDELRAYEILTAEYGFTIQRIIINHEDAEKISKIRIGDQYLFRQNDSTTENLIQLLTDATLTDLEISELKIVFEFPVISAIKTIDKMHTDGTFPYDSIQIANLKCFYNKGIRKPISLLTPKNASSYRSKGKPFKLPKK